MKQIWRLRKKGIQIINSLYLFFWQYLHDWLFFYSFHNVCSQSIANFNRNKISILLTIQIFHRNMQTIEDNKDQENECNSSKENYGYTQDLCRDQEQANKIKYCNNEHFAECYYLNQLKVVQFQQKITNNIGKSSLKQYVIILYDMFAIYEQAFKKVNLYEIYLQLQDILKLMGRATLISIDHSFDTPYQAQNNSLNFQENLKNKHKNHKKMIQLSPRSSIKKYQSPKKKSSKFSGFKMGGIILYNQSYERGIDKCYNNQEKNNQSQGKSNLNREDLNKMVFREIYSEKQIRHSQEKQQMDYFIQRRKRMPDIIINKHHYDKIQRHFEEVQKKVNHMINEHQLQFQLNNIQIQNYDINDIISELIASEKNIKTKNIKTIEQIFYKLHQVNIIAFQRLFKAMQKIKNYKKEIRVSEYGTITDYTLKQAKSYINEIKELEEKLKRKQSIFNELSEAYLIPQHKIISKQSQVMQLKTKLGFQERKNKQLQEKINYLTEITKLKGKNLFGMFNQLSEKNKAYFINQINKNNKLDQTLITKKQRYSITIDKFKRKQKSQSLFSRNSSLKYEPLLTDQQQQKSQQIISKQPKIIQQQEYKIRVSQNLSQIPQQKTKSNRKAHMNSHYLYDSDRKAKQKKAMSERDLNSDIQQYIDDKNINKTYNNNISFLSVNQFFKQNNMSSQQNSQFPAFKPKLTKKTGQFPQPKERFTRKSFQKCFQIESKSRTLLSSNRNIEIDTFLQGSQSNIQKKPKIKKVQQTKSTSFNSKQGKASIKPQNIEGIRVYDFSLDQNKKKQYQKKRQISDYNQNSKKEKIKQKPVLLSNLNHINEPVTKIKKPISISRTLSKSQSQQKKHERKISLKVQLQKFKKKQSSQPKDYWVKMLAKNCCNAQQFLNKVSVMHRKTCSQESCSHIDKYLQNFDKYRKNLMHKKSIKLSVSNLGR